MSFPNLSQPSRFILTAVLGLFVVASPLAGAEVALEAEKTGSLISLTLENDLFVRTDRHYTQGFRYTQMVPERYLGQTFSDISDRLPEWGISNQTRKVGFSLGQNIYTPANINTPAFLPNERPYGGWLYAGLIVQRRGWTPAHRPVAETFELNLGIIGPESLADEAQKFVHEIRDINEPKGWDNQLKTEPGIALRYVRNWLFRLNNGAWSSDLIPHAGGSLGNVATYLNAGSTVRFGRNVPDDFGAQTIDATVPEGGTRFRWGGYGFVGADGRFVVHNAFLDGNLFRSSHSVEKEDWVGELRAGGALVLKRCELSYTYVVRTKEFRLQPQNDAFGSLSLKYQF